MFCGCLGFLAVQQSTQYAACGYLVLAGFYSGPASDTPPFPPCLTD